MIDLRVIRASRSSQSGPMVYRSISVSLAMKNNGFHRGVFEFFDALIQSGVLSDRYENSEIEAVGRDAELSEKMSA